ncbi:MAG: DoxX family protein [Steroidobacteraceae bacterium]
MKQKANAAKSHRNLLPPYFPLRAAALCKQARWPGEAIRRRVFDIKETIMTESSSERRFILLFRLLMAWTFLYSASQVFNPNFSVAGFLSDTKTFHDVYAVLAKPAFDPALTFLVGCGHLLIGLSLLVGLMVRLSSAVAIALLLMYWTAHMDWPFIGNTDNFIIDYHIVYAVVCVYLIAKHAGHVWGLDAWAEKLALVDCHPRLRRLVA